MCARLVGACVAHLRSALKPMLDCTATLAVRWGFAVFSSCQAWVLTVLNQYEFSICFQLMLRHTTAVSLQCHVVPVVDVYPPM